MTTISTSSPATTFVLLEGASDVTAVRALATKAGIDLAGIDLINLHGSTNIGRIIKEIRQIRSDADVVGLCDASDTRAAEKALTEDGLPVSDATDLPMYGFFVCEPDLEGEIIHALGPDAAREALISGGLGSKFDALRVQPEWADKPLAEQVHRFATAPSGRKENATAVLADALDLDALPDALSMLLDRLRWA